GKIGGGMLPLPSVPTPSDRRALPMTAREPDTDDLLERAGRGVASAREALLARHRERLHRMVAVRFDRRLAPRLDPSDVVQEALLAAAAHLPASLRRRPLPFSPCLRRLAWQRLVRLRQQHLALRRSIGREELQAFPLPDESALELAGRLIAPGTSP